MPTTSTMLIINDGGSDDDDDDDDEDNKNPPTPHLSTSKKGAKSDIWVRGVALRAARS